MKFESDVKRIVIEIIDAAKVVHLPKEVPLVWNWEHHASPKNILGEARVGREDGQLVAELLFYGHEDLKRELIKRDLPPIVVDGYPCIGGRVVARKGGEITKIELTEVSICQRPNVDRNVKKLSEQLAAAKP